MQTVNGNYSFEHVCRWSTYSTSVTNRGVYVILIRHLVLSYQRRIHAVKRYFFKRGKRTPLGRTVRRRNVSAVRRIRRSPRCHSLCRLKHRRIVGAGYV